MAGPFTTQQDYYGAAQQAAMPSPESLDRAAARLRSRVDTSTLANQQALSDQYAGRGTTAGGGYNQAMMQNRAAGMNAYSQGLAQQQDDYEKQRQAGAGILSGIGTQIGEQGIQSRGLDINQMLGQQQQDFLRQQLAQTGSLEQQRLGQEKEQGLRQNLIGYFNAIAQGGGTMLDPAFNARFGNIGDMILRALGGTPGQPPAGGYGAPPPVPGAPAPAGAPQAVPDADAAAKAAAAGGAAGGYQALPTAPVGGAVDPNAAWKNYMAKYGGEVSGGY